MKFELQFENILNDFYEYEHFFTQEDFLYFADSAYNKKILEDAFNNDSEFIRLFNRDLLKKYFISKKTLLKWYLRLSLKLAKEKTFRLNQHQLTTSFSFLLINERFTYSPSQLVSFGKHYGFIDEMDGIRSYIFPIAYILSFMNGRKKSILAVNRIIEKVSLNNTIGNISFNYLGQIFLDEGLSHLKNRERYILESRKGLLTGKKVTLNEIGIIENLTRERIRQIEVRAWRKLTHHSILNVFVAALICKIISKQGSLISSSDSSEAILITFLAKCSNIPILNLQSINKIILGDCFKNYCNFESGFQITKFINSKSFLEQLNSDKSICLTRKDVQILSTANINYYKTKLTKQQRVYLALKKIGKPAHFSRIAIVYNSLFPNNPSTEHNVHAVLTRNNNSIVNIGIHGTYALKEWGYEHPSLSLFDTVKTIVKNKYEETNQPVPFNIIISEMGKYRRIVNKNSLVIASHCNPGLQRIGQNSFIPKDKIKTNQEDDNFEDKLDRVLKEMEG